MKKRFKNLLVSSRIAFNNFKAIVGFKLAEAGYGGTLNLFTELEIKHIRNGKVLKIKKVLNRVITDAFVADIVDVLQGVAGPLSKISAYKYHGSGTGTGNEAAGDTALGTEVGSRATGTQIEGATANIYKSVAVVTYDGPYAITEHGLFNASTGPTLMDRTKFAAVNVVNLDSIQFTYSLTLVSGG